MPKFIFECPECGKGMEADTDWSGAPVQCPHCLQPVTIRLNKAKETNKTQATTAKKPSRWGCLLYILIAILFWVWYTEESDVPVKETKKSEPVVQETKKDNTTIPKQAQPEEKINKKEPKVTKPTISKEQKEYNAWKESLPDKHWAWVRVQYIVESQLKNPGSAKFGYGWRNAEISEESGIYIFRSYVDSTNSYGGNVRTYFFCKLQWTKSQKWELLKLTFSEHPF